MAGNGGGGTGCSGVACGRGGTGCSGLAGGSGGSGVDGGTITFGRLFAAEAKLLRTLLSSGRPLMMRKRTTAENDEKADDR